MSSSSAVSMQLDQEIRTYIALRAEAERSERKAAEAKRVLDEQRDRIWDMLESAGVKTITHDLGRITRTARLKALVRDPESLTEWLHDHALYESMTRRDFRQQALNGLVKEMVEAGDELPEGLDTMTVRGITFTAARG